MIAMLAILPLLTSCFSLTAQPRALVIQPNGAIRAMLLDCASLVPPPAPSSATPMLDGSAIRMVTWNIHKEGDAGWQKDLEALSRVTDIVLLQEVTLHPAVRDVLRGVDLRWVMASSFTYGDDDIGVLTASRIAPIASCTQRVVEPILRLPKSAVLSWFGLSGSAQTLAVVNVHAVNFSLSVDTYREQMRAIGDALAAHKGPVIFAGDFNTWSAARTQVIAEVAARLGLREIEFGEDKRTLFFGKQLDHILVRGLDVVRSAAIPVTSSDHNPVTATLQLRQR
jgi:endonuclease/exonuclease/phosphatase (EEP) superfamily protein YafD